MRLRHFLIAGWRAASASRPLSLIAVLGLAIGLTAAILMLLVLRGALGQNHFVPQRARTYLAVSMLSGPGMAPMPSEATNGLAAPLLGSTLAPIEAWARLAEEKVAVRRGTTQRQETIYWADPAIADLLPLPVVRGDLATTLARPDGVAMTAAAARSWFGGEDALGRTIDIAGRTMTVGAILADLSPAETDLAYPILTSARSAAAMQRRMAAHPGSFGIDSRTYIRLRPGTGGAEVERQMRPVVDTLLPPMMKGAYAMRLVRIDRLALDADLHPGARDRLVTGGLIAALILIIAIANYVNLALARAGRRQKEIGIRKAAGAGRRQIAAQFLGEAVLTVLVAALLAMAASEWLLTPLGAFLDMPATVDYPNAPLLVIAILASAALVGLIAGAYPALVVSRLRPAAILRPDARLADGGARLRSALVTLQFAVLIGLLIATAIVYQQRRFALIEGARADIARMLIVRGHCPAAFVVEAARLPGVRGVSCSGEELVSGQTFAFVEMGGRRVPTNLVATLPSLFGLYGIHPIAGSLAGLPPRGEKAVRRVVINEAAVQRLGFSTPEEAIGRTIPVPPFTSGPDQRATIAAVVPDFQFTSVETAVKPTIYVDAPYPPGGPGLVSLKLDGQQIPETLAGIDRLWRATGADGTIDRRFLEDRIEELYRDLARSIQLFAGFALVAVILAGAGMAGIAIAATDRRTKEIGIRKAMGASTGQILLLLLGQLTRPALIANLIAWPITWYFMRRWLEGYAYHIAMPLWLFPAAGVSAFGIAALSISAQAVAAARCTPINALRYE